MHSSLSRKRSTLARRFSWLVVAGMTAAALVGPSGTVLAADKVILCHAAGQDGTVHFNTLEIAWDAAFGQAGHFNEDGTPRAGHEQDYLGACTTTTGTTTTGTTTTGTTTTGTTTTGTTTTGTTTTGTTTTGTTTTGTTTTQSTTQSTTQPTTAAVPAPDGAVAGETGTPPRTLPPTDSLSGSTPTPSGDSWRLILLAMAGILAGTLLLTPTGSVVRRRDS